MKRPAKALVMFAAAAAVYVAALGNSVEGVSVPTLTEAPASFGLESNGFAEEFCSRQQDSRELAELAR